MKRSTPVFIALVLTAAAVPAFAGEPQATEPQPAELVVAFQAPEQNASSLYAEPDAQEPLFLAPDPGELGSCTATARCANGSTVSCSTTSGSCWWVDNCYAVCGSTYRWCSYRPYPCPI